VAKNKQNNSGFSKSFLLIRKCLVYKELGHKIFLGMQKRGSEDGRDELDE
jgi:hypothetical protein